MRNAKWAVHLYSVISTNLEIQTSVNAKAIRTVRNWAVLKHRTERTGPLHHSIQVASFPGSPIFSTHARKEGEPGIQCHVRDVGPYTRVGRVADRENCAWASAISERSGLTRVKKKAILTISEGSTILRGLTELRLKHRR